MSYSRWSSSRWYTLWCCPRTGVTENGHNAIFDICDIERFTAKELRESVDSCLEKVSHLDPDASASDLRELKKYMKQFLNDVSVEYPDDF